MPANLTANRLAFRQTPTDPSKTVCHKPQLQTLHYLAIFPAPKDNTLIPS